MADREPRIEWRRLWLQLRTPFGLSYGPTETRQTCWLRLAGDEGWGEEAIPPYYGVRQADKEDYWMAQAGRIDPLPEGIAEVAAWVGEAGPASARCALDMALHDRIARRQQVPLYRSLGLPIPPSLPTSFTVSIAAPDEMARQAAAATAFSVLKLKMGSNDDASRLAAVRGARPDARLRIDANGAWVPEEAVRWARLLESYGVELIEQPVARQDYDGLALVQASTDLPVVADESFQSYADLDRVAAAHLKGINLKLQKIGGIAAALRAARRAGELGLKVMLGCMIETSLGTTAAAHLASLADWLDLDAPLLIENDPFEGVYFDSTGCLRLPDRPGIGVERRGQHEIL
jgi:L-alanine-DL-glutamate epimerase-like enolase superfamily enzyme